MRRWLILLLLWSVPAHAILPTSTVTNTPTRTRTPTATQTRTASATGTVTNTRTVTNTPASTATRTATGTVTQTPTAYIIYNRDGRVIGVRTPLPTGAIAVVMPDGKNVGVYLDGRVSGGGGGGTPTPCLVATVIPTPGNTTASTANQLADGSLLNGCTATTLVSSISGGFSVGLAGAADFFGTVAGTLASSNSVDDYLPNPMRIVTAESVVFTSTHSSGQFQSGGGNIGVSCTCGAP